MPARYHTSLFFAGAKEKVDNSSTSTSLCGQTTRFSIISIKSAFLA
jgi:hypothetical protein